LVCTIWVYEYVNYFKIFKYQQITQSKAKNTIWNWLKLKIVNTTIGYVCFLWLSILRMSSNRQVNQDRLEKNLLAYCNRGKKIDLC